MTWDNLQVYEGVRAFVKSRPGTICMTHASHFYPQGTNLYFIFILRPEDVDEYVAFRAGSSTRSSSTVGPPATTTGWATCSRRGWRVPRHEQMDVLRALKAHFDPHGIMNPGNTLGLGAIEEVPND